jgi:hypothetical protein
VTEPHPSECLCEPCLRIEYLNAVLRLREASSTREFNTASLAVSAARQVLDSATRVRNVVTGPGLYQHFKGGTYRVLHTAEKCTEDQTGTVVVYLSLSTGKLFVRDDWDFNALIDPETKKAFEGGPSMLAAARDRLVPRFERIGD